MKWKILGAVISISIISYMLITVILTNFVIKDNDESANLEDYSSGLVEDNDETKKILNESADSNKKKENTIAPNFELTTLSGDTVKLSDYKGKQVLLNFWASWCDPCKEEMPHIQKYYEEKAKDSDVEVITVNMTKYERNDIGKVRDFVEDYDLTFPVLIDQDGKVMDLYEINFFPTTYILNKEGLVTDVVNLPLDDKIIDELINKDEISN